MTGEKPLSLQRPFRFCLLIVYIFHETKLKKESQYLWLYFTSVNEYCHRLTESDTPWINDPPADQFLTDWPTNTRATTDWPTDRSTDWYRLINRLTDRSRSTDCPSPYPMLLSIYFSETANSNFGELWAVCSSDEQCQNGGLCLNNSCVCVYGYTGLNCEAKLQCNDFNCVNNGTCELDLQANKTFCSCNQQTVSDGRFEGVFCEKKVPCNALGYCLKGGVCHRDPYHADKFFCKCPDGFIGPVCEERTSCSNHFPYYCRHGGVCDSNKCQCASGYTGYFCELQVTPGMSRNRRGHLSVAIGSERKRGPGSQS